MGEMADYMLNGDDCQECGEYIGEGDGYPRSCAACAKAEAPAPRNKKVPQKTIQCDAGCKKWFASKNAKNQHVRDAHKPKDTTP